MEPESSAEIKEGPVLDIAVAASAVNEVVPVAVDHVSLAELKDYASAAKDVAEPAKLPARTSPKRASPEPTETQCSPTKVSRSE